MRKISCCFLIFSLLLTLGCHRSTQAPFEKKVLRVNFTFDPPTLDPRKGADHISSTIQFMLFEGLTKITPESTAAPGLAEHIEISDDKLLYTFHMREAYWSNGDRITARDVEMTWKDMLSPAFPAPNAHLLYPILGAEAAKQGRISLEEVGIHSIDDATLQVRLSRPTPYFLELTSFCALFPIHQKTAKHHPDWADDAGPHLITSGPFKIKKWKRHHNISLVPSENYFNRSQVKLDKIRISMIADDMTALQMFENGELDIIGSVFSNIPSDSLPHFLKSGELKRSPVGATTMVTFNTQRSLLDNVHFRRALSLAINRQKIIENITQLDERVASGPVPPILKRGHNTQFYPDNAREQACTEMIAAQLPEHLRRLKLSYPAGGVASKIAQVLQHVWKKALDIDVDLEGYELSTFIQKLQKKDYDLALYSWVVQYNDPMNILERFQDKSNAKNYPSWENEKYSNILKSAAAISDPQERYLHLERAEKILTEEMPLACLYHWDVSYLQKQYVKNFYISPIGSVHLERVDLNRFN